MEIKDIKEIIDHVSKNSINKFQLEIDGVKIYIDNDNQYKTCNREVENCEKKVEDEKKKFILSPMVGACHISTKDDGKKKEKGDCVDKGDIICVIEAMKIFNEIKSEYKGEIEEVLFNDGDVVEYNQPLFKIRLC